MTEQKRPVLTLKRKTEGETPTRSRKTIINVTTPPKWKVKKQKLAEKAAREAELTAKKAQARQALSIYLNLPSLDEAVNTLKPWWPGLFDGDTPRLLACGIRDVLLEDVAQRNIPLSHKKLRRALKAITRSESYLCAMKAGACRYDTEGYVTEHISQEEEVYAAERLDKIRRQNRIKAELQAVLDATGTDTETENGRGNTDPEPENHHQCHHATKMEGEKAETGGEGCPGSRADSKKSAGQTGAVHLSEPALAG